MVRSPRCPVSHAPSDRIGPNAIIQVAHVLQEWFGQRVARPWVQEATGFPLEQLPDTMVEESRVRALIDRVLEELGESRGPAVLREAGCRTADYLLAHRIPRPAQWLIRNVPPPIGLALLLRAMRANAWTFAGSGQFSFRQGRAVTVLTFERCALCRDRQANASRCDFYAGTFERLVRVLVAPHMAVTEVECRAHGGTACRFEVRPVH
jgi:divinyl protochlorophyllide a 8-vinyl-reductase